jgi:prophage DNA circulation protein
MSLAELRDLFIVIFSIVGIGATIFFVVIAIKIYPKIRDTLDSVRSITENIQIITSTVAQDLVKPMANSVRTIIENIRIIISTVTQDVVKPLGSMVSIIQGISKAMAGIIQGISKATEFVYGLPKRKEGRKGGYRV